MNTLAEFLFLPKFFAGVSPRRVAKTVARWTDGQRQGI